MNAIEIVKTFITALQSGDLEGAANIASDDFTMRGMTPKTLNRGQFLVMQSELLEAMPDFSYNLDDIHKEGAEVSALIRITGTNLNDLSMPLFGVQNIPAPGLAVELPQVQVLYSVKDDKVTAMKVKFVPGSGLWGLLQQIGGELPVAPRLADIAD